MAPLLILTALESEARAISRALGLPRRPGDPCPCGGAGRCGEDGKSGGVQLRVIGIRGMAEPGLLNLPSGGTVLLAGLAGGLDPSLAAGDLILDGGPDGLAARIGARPARVHAADGIVGSVAQKADLFRTTGAAAVDMESGIVRAAAAKAGCDLAVLRSVCDPAGFAISPVLSECVDPVGRPRLGRLAREIARRPALAGELAALQRLSSIAMRTLAPGAARCVQELGADQPGLCVPRGRRA